MILNTDRDNNTIKNKFYLDWLIEQFNKQLGVMTNDMLNDQKNNGLDLDTLDDDQKKELLDKIETDSK